MKVGLHYPKYLWLYMIALFATACIPVINHATYYALAITALAAPALRNKFLHPLGTPDQAYFKWLKTVPYKPSDSLPNGTVYPNWQDALFLFLLCIPSLALTKLEIPTALFISAVLIYLTLLIFCYITARQLLNLGPRWIGYTIFALLLISLRVAFFSVQSTESFWLTGIAVLPAFLVAIVGLRIMMSRYPWSNMEPNISGLVANRTYINLVYGYTQVTEAGEPYTTLRPDGYWPRLPWIDSVATSLLAGLLMALLDFDKGSETYFGLIAAGSVYARFSIYFTTKSIFGSGNLFRGALGGFRKNQHFTNAIFPIIVLITMLILGIFILRYTSWQFSRFFAPLFIVVIYIAAIKLPPSRARWETMGEWQLQMEPGDTYTGKNKSKIKN